MVDGYAMAIRWMAIDIIPAYKFDAESIAQVHKLVALL